MILRRYVLRRVLGRTGFVLGAAVLLYIVVDVMGISQQLARGTLLQILQLYLLRLPEIVVRLLPAALVLGPLLAMGSLAKRFELSAIKFTGGSMTRIVAPPFLVMGAVAGLSLLLLTEEIQPRTAASAVKLQEGVFNIRGPRYWTFYWPRRWMRTPEGFLHARGVRSGSFTDVTYVRHDASFRPAALVRARELRTTEKGYELVDGTLHHLGTPPGKARRFAELEFPEPLVQGTLAQHLGYPEVFDIPRLMQIVEIHRAQGGRIAPFLLSLWRRVADPLLLVALSLLLVPIASWSRRGQLTERRLIEGAGIIGLFYLVRGAFGAAASQSSLDCAVAAFGPVLALLLLSALVWLRVEYERGLP